MCQVGRQHAEALTLRALELLAGCDLDRGLSCGVGDEEVHGQIFTVHVVVHPRLDVTRQQVGVHVAVVL